MLFKNVSIAGLAHVDAPHTLTTKEINERLQPTLDRLGIRTDVLGDIDAVVLSSTFDEDGARNPLPANVADIVAAYEKQVPTHD